VWSVVKNELSKEGEIQQHVHSHSIDCDISTTIDQDETVSLYKYTILCDSIRYENGREQALALMNEAAAKTLAGLYEEQEEFLARYWENASVDVDGDDELSMAIYYNLYQLLQSVGKDRFSNIAAKGLSGEGYEGHYFWDTEMYIQPFFLLTQPDIVKNLIEYRYNILDFAREHAKIMGH